MIGVRVLGPLEVTVDGAPADVGGPRQRCVLARLIAAQGRVVSADRLVEDLYAEEAPPKALAAVQSYVSHLRRALEPGRAARAPAGVLVTSPPGYAVRLSRDAVDAWSFEDEAHRAAGLDDPAAAHSRLSAALASWHGAAFEEFGGLPWADLEASRLEELRLTAAEARAEAALRLGRAAQTVADLSRMTAEHPLREEAWRLLALALYQSGRQGDALAALRRARARLAADLVGQRLAAEGWTVTIGRCPEHEGAPAGWPWAETLRRLARTVPPADPQALGTLLTDTPARDRDAAVARFRLHRAVAAYLEEVSQAAPLLVVLDDLHRADGETLAILTDVTADPATSRILVLATYRPAEVTEPLSSCLAALAAREPDRVALRGLDAAAAGELIRATCGRPVDGQTARVIAERTGGNPFFIKETARLLDSEGALAATTEVPAGVREVLQRRVARLPATAQTILRQAAVIGTEADVDVLGDVAGVEEQVLLDAIDAGLLTGLVTEPGPGRVRFAHALVRDTLYQGLSRLRRSRLHARAAEAIERHSPGEVATLAYHFTEAGTDPVRAARYCRLAAAQAELRFAYPEAARLWEQALACLDQAPGAPARDRLELVLGLESALAHGGQLARARSYRHDAVRAALPLGDPVLLARVITAFDVPRVWFSEEYGDTDNELVGTVEQTLARLPSGDEALRCRLLTTLALELEAAESERGYQASAQAVEMARRLDDPGLLTMAINGRYMQSYRYDGLAERQSLGAELLALPGKPVTVEALAHLMLMAASSGAGDFATADLHADQAARIAERYDVTTAVTALSMYRAMRAALDGDPAGAADLYQQAAAGMERLGLRQQGAGVSILGRFALLVMQDRMAEMTGELELICSLPRAATWFSEHYALALAAAGRATEARAVAGRPRPIRRGVIWLFMTGIRGLLAIAIDDRERAESAYQALLPYAARPVGADSTVMTLWPAAQLLGDLARHFGLPGAQAHYEHALALAGQAHVKWWREAAMKRLDQRR